MFITKFQCMSKKKLPLSLLMISGAVGKSFVIRHYKFGTFMSKYPDMTKIVASKEQRKCRNLFKEAVAWAKTVIADADRKKEWQKRLKKSKRVYHAAIKQFMLRENKKLQQAEQIQSISLAMTSHAVNQPSIPFMYKRLPEIKFLSANITGILNMQKMTLFETG